MWSFLLPCRKRAAFLAIGASDRINIDLLLVFEGGSYMPQQRLFLLDGHSLAFRAFFALPLLSTASGRYTNATYGFAMMLTRLLEDNDPEFIAVAFDKGKPTERLKLYADYKGTRERTPTEMAEQIPYIKEILAAYKIPMLEVDGYEADDIIGTLAKQATDAGLETVIVTGDRDTLQLVSKSVTVWLTRRGITDVEVYDEAAVRERYGLVPQQLTDLKALMGDSSDNIPGVPGIGEKTGIKLLKEAGNLDALLAHPEAYTSKKTLERLRTYRDQALLSRDLGTIVCDLPLSLGIADLKRQAADYHQLASVYQEYELRSLLEKLPLAEIEGDPQGPQLAVCDWRLVNNEADEERLSELLAQEQRCALLTTLIEEELYVAISFPDEPVYVVASFQAGLLERLANSATCQVVGHDLKAAAVALASRMNIVLPSFAGDTMLAAYLLDPSQSSYELEQLISGYLATGLPQQEGPLANLATACAALWPLLEKLESKLEELNLANLYRDVEIPLGQVLAAMELQGVYVDQGTLAAMQLELEERLSLIMEEIYSAAGQQFNLNSPKQLGQILFDQLRLPVIKKTKTGYSTDAEVLETLADEHIIVRKILEYRQLAKLKSTYLDGLLQVINQEDSKVHTTYHQTVTTTGRLSSSEPNLQNIPVRLEEGRRIRRAFLPSPGADYIMSADYSQIELRILAHISQDPILIKAFLHDEDIHTRTAAEVFGVELDEVTPEMRSRAKAVNFGIVYGISDYGLARDLKVSRAEAKDYIERYFKRYAGVRNYIDRVIAQARQDGYVTTLLQRRRYLPDINSRNFNLRSFAERTAMNTPIQGSAADQIKLAMVNIDRRLKAENFSSKMILQVHDELIFEVYEPELAPLARLVKSEMETAIQLLVPLKVDIKVGTNWYNVEPYTVE